MRQTRPDHGLTLIELTVALLIFALVAVMGLQALTGMLRMRDRLSDIDNTTAELGFAVNLLRSDLSAMVPMTFRAPSGGVQSALTLSGNSRELAFSIAGQPDLPPVDALGLHRVVWRLDPQEEILTRQVWPVLAPASPSAAYPETVVLSNVTSLSLRSYWPDTGWQSGAQRVSASGAPVFEASDGPSVDLDTVLRAVTNSYSDQLPEAVEVTFETTAYGAITLVESLQ